MYKQSQQQITRPQHKAAWQQKQIRKAQKVDPQNKQGAASS
jgi:hypothetical protein